MYVAFLIMLRVFASFTSFSLSYSEKKLKFYLLLLIRFIFTSQNRIIFLTNRILVDQIHFIFLNAVIKGWLCIESFEVHEKVGISEWEPTIYQYFFILAL